MLSEDGGGLGLVPPDAEDPREADGVARTELGTGDQGAAGAVLSDPYSLPPPSVVVLDNHWSWSRAFGSERLLDTQGREG